MTSRLCARKNSAPELSGFPSISAFFAEKEDMVGDSAMQASAMRILVRDYMFFLHINMIFSSENVSSVKCSVLSVYFHYPLCRTVGMGDSSENVMLS